MLRKVTDEFFGDGGLLKDIMAVYFDASRRGGKTAGHNIHRCGFSRAVGTQKTVDVAVLDFKGQVIHGNQIAVIFCQMFHGYHDKSPAFLKISQLQK